MANDQKKLVKRFYDECMNNKNLNVIDEICDPNYKLHGFRNTIDGTNGLKAVCNDFIKGFPDLKLVAEDIKVDGDRVTVHGYWQGTNKGDFRGVHASGKRVRMPFTHKWLIKNGKLVEGWSEMDMDSLINQIGGKGGMSKAA